MIEFVHYTATDLERLEAWSRLKYNDEINEKQYTLNENLLADYITRDLIWLNDKTWWLDIKKSQKETVQNGIYLGIIKQAM